MIMGFSRTRRILDQLALAAFLTAPPLAVCAQTGSNYNVQTMNFDLWCQEQQHLAPERCDKRLPGDVKDFESYRDVIERYEIPYLQRKQNEIMLDRNILHNDPVDNPPTRDSQTQTLHQQRVPAIDPRTPQP
jgi:hypothetical protein